MDLSSDPSSAFLLASEAYEDDIKIEIKAETNNEYDTCEEVTQDINSTHVVADGSSGSSFKLTESSFSYGNSTSISDTSSCSKHTDHPKKKLIPKIPASKICRILHHCPLSVPLHCPICPKLVKGGLSNLPHLKNHIITHHYDHRKHLLSTIRKFKMMTKQCECLSSGNSCEVLFKHLNMIN